MKGRVEQENKVQNPLPNLIQIDRDDQYAVYWERVSNEIIYLY